MSIEKRHGAEQKEAGAETGEDGGFVPCLLSEIVEAGYVAGEDADRVSLFRQAMSAREPLQMTPNDADAYTLRCRSCSAACLLRLVGVAEEVTRVPDAPHFEVCPLDAPFEQ